MADPTVEEKAKQAVANGLALFKGRDWPGSKFKIPGGLLSAIWEKVEETLDAAITRERSNKIQIEDGFELEDRLSGMKIQFKKGEHLNTLHVEFTGERKAVDFLAITAPETRGRAIREERDEH